MKVLFVCTGNTCRSPMAMALAQEMYPDWEFQSAGIFAFGSPISENAVRALQKEGIDYSRHTSQPVTEELLAWADVVLTMSRSHKEQVLQLDDTLPVYTLPEAAGGVGEVADPYGGALSVYESTMREIKTYLEALKKWQQ